MKKRYQDTSHARYLTFGCYRRKHLFSHPELADLFIQKLDQWRKEHSLHLWAYVVMPNHVHLLIHDPGMDLGKALSGLKRSFALDAMEWIPVKYPVTYSELEALDHGKTVHRFWQTGGGYDRNVFSDEVVRKAIQYIHNNPVKAGLVQYAEEYRWSSARFWLKGIPEPIELDIPEWWTS